MADNIYNYAGPIKRFGKVVAKEWEGETTAPSLARAINNLKFQAKQYLGLTKDAKVEIDTSKIIEMTGLDEEETEEYNRSYDPDYDIPDEWEGDFDDSEALTSKEKQLCDYVIENLDHNNNPKKALKLMKTYYSAYQELAYAKEEAVLNYFKENIKESFEDCDINVKDSEDDVYDVYYEDRNNHKQGSFKRRTWNQVDRLMNNKNLRIIAVSPSEDENPEDYKFKAR